MNRLDFLKALGLLGLSSCIDECDMDIKKINWWKDGNSESIFKISLNGINSISAVGDSITVGQNSSPSSNAYINLFKSNNSIATLKNGAVSGRGVWKAINDLNDATVGTYTRSSTLLTAMAGLNDIRRGGSNPKTLKKIEACYKSFLMKHLCSTVINAQSGSVTKSGTHVNFNYDSLGGANLAGTYTTTSGAYWEYTWTGTSIMVSLMAQDGVTSTGWGTSKIYIDEVLQDTFSHSGVWYDAISDGSYNNAAGPVAWYKFGLTNTTHTIRVEAQSTANSTLDFFAVPDAPASAGKVLFFEIPYLNSTGYAISPSNGSTAISDTASSIIENLCTEFQAYGYNVAYVPTNEYYDLATGLDTDNIHPNNTGHSQIAEAAQSRIL